MKRKRYRDMTAQEKIEHNYNEINTRSKTIIFLSILNMVMLILANLDKIVSFLMKMFS